MFQNFSASVSIAAAALAVLYLVIRDRRSPNSRYLALVLILCAAIELLDLLSLRTSAGLSPWKMAVLVCEGLLAPCWLLLGISLCGKSRWSAWPFLVRLLLVASPAFLLSLWLVPFDRFFYNPEFPEEPVLFLGRMGLAFYVGLLVYLVYALVLMEQALTGLTRIDRWKLKFEVIGISSILAIHFFYYCNGLLFRSLDMGLAPARSLSLVLGVGLIGFSRIRRGVPGRLGLTRVAAYRSVALLAVGFYLFGLGLAGEGMRYIGTDSQRLFMVVLGLVGAVGLLSIILSDTLRRKTRVFIHEHFFQEKYDYRRHWLDFTASLAQCRTAGDTTGAVLEFFCEALSVRGGLLYLRNGGQGDFFASAIQGHDTLPDEPISGNGRLTSFFHSGQDAFDRLQWPAEVDTENRPLFDRLDIHFVVPLFFENHLDGFVLLGSPMDSGEMFFFEDYDLMKVLAAQAAVTLHNQRLIEQLANVREMAAVGKVAAFVMHDLKNAVANLSLVVDNARNYIDDPEFQKDMLSTLANSAGQIKRLIDRLKNFEQNPDPQLSRCNLYALAAEVIADFPGLDIDLRGGDTPGLVDRTEIGKVILNLIHNSLEATGGKGPVALEVDTDIDAGRVFVRCRDHGCGMSRTFIREHLFRPFETTKQHGFGIGLYQCRQIVEAHGGHITIESEVGRGTEFTIWLPSVEGPAVDGRLSAVIEKTVGVVPQWP